MLITYFDEVKFERGRQPYYWLGGLSATPEMIWSLEAQAADLANECFGDPTLSKSTEFHAAEIFHRKKNFKGWKDIDARINVINRLASIIDSAQGIGKIHVRLEPARIFAGAYEAKAFMFFVERVEMHLKAQNSPGILIGDQENSKVSGKFAESLSRYRFSGTEYAFGRKLEFLIDTVHFTDSHHSRMLQLADVYAWLLQLCTVGDKNAHPQCLVIEHVRKKTDLLSPSRYKHWPPEN